MYPSATGDGSSRSASFRSSVARSPGVLMITAPTCCAHGAGRRPALMSVASGVTRSLRGGEDVWRTGCGGLKCEFS